MVWAEKLKMCLKPCFRCQDPSTWCVCVAESEQLYNHLKEIDNYREKYDANLVSLQYELTSAARAMAAASDQCQQDMVGYEFCQKLEDSGNLPKPTSISSKVSVWACAIDAFYWCLRSIDAFYWCPRVLLMRSIDVRALLMRSIDVCAFYWCVLLMSAFYWCLRVLLMSACSIDVCVFWYLLPCWMSAWYWCLRVGVLSLCQEGFCLFSNWGNSSALLAKMFKAVPEFLTCPYKCISFWRTACYTCAVLIYTGGVTTPKCSVYCVIRFRVRGC